MVKVPPAPQLGGLQCAGSPGVLEVPHLEVLQLPPVILQLPPLVLDLRLTFPLLLGGGEQRSWGRLGEGTARRGDRSKARVNVGRGSLWGEDHSRAEAGMRRGYREQGAPGRSDVETQPVPVVPDRPWGQLTGSSPPLRHISALTGGN